MGNSVENCLTLGNVGLATLSLVMAGARKPLKQQQRLEMSGKWLITLGFYGNFYFF